MESIKPSRVHPHHWMSTKKTSEWFGNPVDK